MKILRRASASCLFLAVLFLAAWHSKAQTGTYQFITLDASPFAPLYGPLANYVAANQTLIKPISFAVDPSGNVYFSEVQQIRKVTTDGRVVSVAGYLTNYFAYHCCGGGDGGPALVAGVTPGALAFDRSGNLWFSETSGSALRRITPSGIIDTVEPFGGPIAADPNGNVYVAAGVVQKISPDGTVTQYPGVNNQRGPIAADSSGAVYAATNHQIQKILPNGVITTLAGNGTAGYTGDGGPAVDAEVDLPEGVAVDSGGNVYFSDYNWGVVRKIFTDGTITTVAGGGSKFGEGGPAKQAALSRPTTVGVDSAGNLYILEAGYYLLTNQGGLPTGGYIRKVTPDGNIHTVAGLLLTGCCGDGAPASQAIFTGPSGVARDSRGNVYVADPLQHKVRKIAADLTVTTVAGSGLPGFTGDDGPAAAATLDTPVGVAVDGAGNVYIADSGNNRIRMVTGDGNIRTIAGNGVPIFAGDGGPAISASLAGPNFVLADGSGSLFIADTDNHRIRKITPDGAIQTVAGNGAVGFTGDGGPAIAAALATPRSLAVDASGNLYIADNPVHTIRKVSSSGIITTFAGTPSKLGYAGDGGPANRALLNSPYGVVVDGAGNVLIADTANSKIRKVTPDGVINSIQSSDPHDVQPDRVLALAPDANGNLYFASSHFLQGYVGYAYIGVSPLPRFAPSVSWSAIRNAAGAQGGGAVAPGMIASIYGGNLGPQQGVSAGLDSSGNFGNSLAGVQVFFNGIAAPIIYAQAGQINLVTPFEVAGMSTVDIHVEYNGMLSNINTLPVTPTFPGLFTQSNFVAAINQDGALNSGEPAPQGSVIQVFATGGGQTNPGEADGVLVTGTVPVLLAQARAKIQYVTTTGQASEVPAPVLYAGPAPTLVAGVLQVNVQIPPLPGLALSLGVPAPILTIYVDGAAASSNVQLR